MDVKKFVLREIGVIAIGQGICLAGMFGVFALIGKFDRTVILGGILGAVFAILNFFFMALAVNEAADRAAAQDVKGGKGRIRSSYFLRMIVLFAVLFAGAKSGVCNPFAMVIPFLFVRPAITVAEFFRKSGEEKV